MYRRCMSTTPRRLKGTYAGRKTKQTHWSEEEKLLNNINRALTHYDDFYGGIFSHQWPSLRLGLLTPPKYFAVPNTFTARTELIAEKLQEIGAYNVKSLWTDQKALMEKERAEIDLKKDLGRLHQLDRTMESIAKTKRAEELDVLYQNAPTSRRQEIVLGKGPLDDSRIISDVSEAAADFIPSTKLKGIDEFTFDSEYFTSYIRQYNTDDEGGSQEDEDTPEVQFLKAPRGNIEFPKLILPFTFENGSNLMFPPAARDSASGLREYICINGASIIPVMALDLTPETRLLDLCAGPGTKSLLSYMTMTIDSITCNDLEISRLNRVQRIMHEFTGSRDLPDVSYTKFNARDYPAREEFSRVLADVPCLNDRVSCTVADNNIFKPRRTKERLTLVKTQREILLSGFRALEKKEGSAIVYSTCTLSPVENDGVVMNALKDTEVADLYIDLIGLVKLVTPFERAGLFKIQRTRCGILVLPNTVCNFGPMYISKMVMIPKESDNSDSAPLSSEDSESEFSSQQVRS